MNSNLSEDDIKGLISKPNTNTNTQKKTDEVKPIKKEKEEEITMKLDRNILVIGAGDGGANIASAIKKDVGCTTFIYNTSMRTIMDRLEMDKFIHPGGEDGSGKMRSYSKDVFKEGAYKYLQTLIEELPKKAWSYNIITTTTDGGTGGGASPNIAKFTEAVTKDTTIVIGVYPSISEDDRSQSNTLKWQADIEKTELPYMIFDNDKYKNMNTLQCHEKVNEEIVTAVAVFSGKIYGESNTLDNKDFSKLVSRSGRINIYSGTRKPRVDETMTTYIEKLIEESSQPLPDAAEAYGLFVKGPKDFIENISTDITDIMMKYGGTSKDVHIEESTEVAISLIIAGSAAPNPRLKSIKKRYDDLMSFKAKKESTVNSLLEGVEDPVEKKSKVLDNALDALNF